MSAQRTPRMPWLFVMAEDPFGVSRFFPILSRGGEVGPQGESVLRTPCCFGEAGLRALSAMPGSRRQTSVASPGSTTFVTPSRFAA